MISPLRPGAAAAAVSNHRGAACAHRNVLRQPHDSGPGCGEASASNTHRVEAACRTAPICREMGSTVERLPKLSALVGCRDPTSRNQDHCGDDECGSAGISNGRLIHVIWRLGSLHPRY